MKAEALRWVHMLSSGLVQLQLLSHTTDIH